MPGVEGVGDSAGSAQNVALPAGVVLPPPDIRSVVDKTVEFVRKVGPDFESQLIAKNAGQKKFQFLQPDNVYHAYYRAKLAGDTSFEQQEAQVRQKIEDEQKRKADQAAESQRLEEEEKKKTLTLSQRLKQLQFSTRKAKVPPMQVVPPEEYSVKVPSLFAPVDVDIVKLTAMYVARNGRAFLTSLKDRERTNRQFDFMDNPNHPLFTLFQAFTAAYSNIIRPKTEFLEQLRQDAADPQHVLERAVARSKHAVALQDEEKRKQEGEENERLAMAQIDWSEFAVVESIGFTEEEEHGHVLPAPFTTIEEINAMLQAQAIQEQNLGIGANAGAGVRAMEDDMDMDVDMDVDDGASKLEPADEMADQVRRAAERSRAHEASARSMRFQQCPICKQDIPIEEISEHMRIELLDPRWKHQKVMAEEKTRESSLADNVNVTANLARLASKRTDVFEPNYDERPVKQETRPEPTKAPMWDGHSESASTVRAQAAQLAAQQASRPPVNPPPPPAVPLPATGAKPALPPGQIPLSQQMVPPVRPPPPGANAPMVVPVPAPLPPMPPMPGMPPSMGRPPMPMMGMPAGFPMPPMGMPGMPPLPGMAGMAHPAPPMEDEPSQKRAKTADVVSEEEWLKRHPGNIGITVAVPNDPEFANWNFKGQVLSFQFSCKDTVAALKDKIMAQLGIPSAKQKLRVIDGQHLNKDEFSLAKYNVPPGGVVDLGVKERGGRKK